MLKLLENEHINKKLLMVNFGQKENCHLFLQKFSSAEASRERKWQKCPEVYAHTLFSSPVFQIVHCALLLSVSSLKNSGEPLRG